jgi:hypothetical protein
MSADTPIPDTKNRVDYNVYLKVKRELNHYRDSTLTLLTAMLKIHERVKVMNEVNLGPQVQAVIKIINEASAKAQLPPEPKNPLGI